MFNNMFALQLLPLAKKQLKSVCEIGNQTLNVAPGIKEIFVRDGYDVTKSQTVKQFYEALGFEKYIAIDVNNDKDAIALDLNTIVYDKINEKFDLVTNNGTSEHIFNQHSVFANIHNLCKVGGYMIHVLPCTGWVDHGFYNYNPNLFTAIAEQNDYNIEWTGFGVTNADLICRTNFTDVKERNPSRKEYVEILNQMGNDTMLMAVMQKTTDNEFKIPMQKIYSNSIDSQTIWKSYR
jgi:hypothetical protein